MRSSLLLLLGFGLGAIAGILAAELFAAPTPAAAPTPQPPPAQLADDVRARLAAIERKLDDLLSRPERIATVNPGDHAARGGATLDERALEAVIARRAKDQELARWQAMSPRTLLAAAAKLRRKDKDADAARRTLEHLLARQLSGKDRAAALTELGLVESQTNRPNEAEIAFRGAIDHAGDAADERAWAGYQLAIALNERGRAADGLAAAEAALAVTGTGKWVRVHCRWAVAAISQAVGNVARARAECEQLLVEIGDATQQYQWCVDDVNARLAKMR